MALSKREWIYIGGAVGAWLILKPGTPGKPGLLSKLKSAVKIPKQTPRPTTTNLATGYGSRTTPVGPSSGVGFNPTTGARSTSLTPVTAGIVTGGSVLTSLINGLFKRQPTGTTTTKPSSSSSPSKPPQGAPSGNTSGPTGGQKTTGSPGAVSRGGAIADQPTPDGFYSASGTWVPTDSDGNVLQNPDGTYPGYYDRNPASPTYGDYIEGNVLDSSSMYDPSGGGGLQAVIPDVQPQYDFSTPESDPALEVTDPGIAPDNSNLDQIGTVVPVDDLGVSNDASDYIPDPGTSFIYDDGSSSGADVGAADLGTDQWTGLDGSGE